MKYIDAEKLIAEIERRIDSWSIRGEHSPAGQGKDTCESRVTELSDLLSFITSLQQEQPKGNLEYWLEHFGMPKENIDNCITQIAQGYGACRYLEGIQHGAEAVNELAKQEQPEVDLDFQTFAKEMVGIFSLSKDKTTNTEENPLNWEYSIARHFYDLGLNARKV